MAERLQIKFEFNTTEDRLLLRIAVTKSHAPCVEYRFWLTRRFVQVFIKALDKLIEEEVAADMQVSPAAKDAMKKFQHEAALSKADFSTSYGADAENCAVFGEEPLLVSMLRVRKRLKGKYVLSLLNNKKQGIHLKAGMELLHSLQKLLQDSAHGAGWNKPLFQVAADGTKTIKAAGYIS